MKWLRVCVCLGPCMNGVKKFPLCCHVRNWIQHFFWFFIWFCLFCRSECIIHRYVAHFFCTQLHSTVFMLFMCVTFFLFYVSSPIFFLSLSISLYGLIYMWSISDCMVGFFPSCVNARAPNFHHINFSFMLNIRNDERKIACSLTIAHFRPSTTLKIGCNFCIYFLNTIHFLFS